uniref:hypothetical protein n=1 Tax=Vibrio sp. 10N.222.47.A9 TaxID=1903178 RepID=UPI001A96B0F8
NYATKPITCDEHAKRTNKSVFFKKVLGLHESTELKQAVHSFNERSKDDVIARLFLNSITWLKAMLVKAIVY